MLFGECGSMSVSKIESFLEHFVDIKKILKEYSLTHDTKYSMMWRNTYMMNDNYG
jgi:hypothetical protein